MQEKAMEVQIISTETIKPSSPTPHHKKTFKISIFDQLTPPVYTNIAYFYLSEDAAADSKFQRLKTSLSKTLAGFYPFAGRIKGNFSIDCNDDGAVFVQAHAHLCLSDFLKNRTSDDNLLQFFPVTVQSDFEGSSGLPLLFVQATLFHCGGLAIGFMFSHKVADGATMGTFISAWSAAASSSGNLLPELLTGPTLFPAKDFLANWQLPTASKEHISTNRFVFSAPNIALLKSKAVATGTSGRQPPPTRVESVAALIWKCVTKACRSNSPEDQKKKASVLFQNVNLRRRFSPPLPEKSTGNFVSYYAVESGLEDGEIKLHEAVEGLKSGIKEFCDGFVKKLQEELAGEGWSSVVMERLKLFQRENADTCNLTSWCRFGGGEADFGWGKPAWIATARLPFKNTVVLTDASDGGIEAWVSLKNQDMAVFERDEELLLYSDLNPPAILILN